MLQRPQAPAQDNVLLAENSLQCEHMDVRFCVFITAGFITAPSTKLFACVWGRYLSTLKDMCYERRRAEACVD